MNVRRLVSDVKEAVAQASILQIGDAIEAVNITVTEIDVEPVGFVQSRRALFPLHLAGGLESHGRPRGW